MNGVADQVFDRFPHGLLITVEGGAVVTSNAAGSRVLGRTGIPSSATCCSLLGCRAPESPLREVCVTERALASGESLPEVRVDLRGEAGEELAVWIVAAPLDSGRVVLELRPGRPGDRRRRTDPHWTAGPSVRVFVLGRTRVLSPEGPLEGAWLRQRPGRLLKYLVANRGRIVHTDELAMTFWPEAERTGLQNVRYFVHGLRSHLEPNRTKRGPSSFITGHDGGYAIDTARVRVDADEFEDLAHGGLRALARGEEDDARATLERAAAMYQGEFLADEPYAEWAFAERGRLHELACGVLDALATIALDNGAPETATQHLQRLADLEPLDDEVQRRLLTLLLVRGRSGEALRRYRHMQQAWIEALGEPPDFDLAGLRRELRATPV